LVLKDLPKSQHPDLLVGFGHADDAGVFRLSDDLALIQTVDFFTPVVDDPFLFGQISAANSLSDVYAMGGKPITCLNIVAFPNNQFPLHVLSDILRGGYEKVQEAGAVLAGGHTISDDEMKYGLSVTGIVHPDKILQNAGAKIGDSLVLTKPIGSGIISTAIKKGIASEKAIDSVTRTMAQLNRVASECMQEIGVNAATDVTGYGLLGHAYEMAHASQVGLEISVDAVPVMPAAFDYYEQNTVPGGTKSNQEFLEDKVTYDGAITDDYRTIVNDAQTSGGLLISVPNEKNEALISLLHERGIAPARKIGEVIPKDGPWIRVLV
jgi:selenide,water dikinase